LLAAVKVGGTITLAPGEFVVTKQIDIRKDGTTLRASSPGKTTIRFSGNTGRPIEVNAKSVTVDGIIVTGGSNPFDDGGGGIEVEGGKSLTLIRSTVTGNKDDRGGGILNEGTITIIDSTISDNEASIKGGGLLNEGTATVTNSTIEGNTSPLGAGITSFSTINLLHATVAKNVSTFSSVAGLQRYGGAFNVRYSIIGDNLRSNGSIARNCGGTVQLRDQNLVNDKVGCTTSGTITVAPIRVGVLQDNGGPTPTASLLDGSPALDVVKLNAAGNACVSGVKFDQRGTARPSGSLCDLGAFEKAPLVLADPTFDVDTANYAARGLPAGTVEVGATSVATRLIAGRSVADAVANADGTLESARLRSIRLRSIRLRSIELQDIRLRSIDASSTAGNPEAARLRSIELKANRLRSIALESIRLRSIDLESIRLRSIPLESTRLRSIRLRSIPLSEIPLTDLPGGWEELLAGTPFDGVPLQSLTLDDVAGSDENDVPLVPGLDGQTLASIDLSSTRLRSIRLRSILLEGTRLRSIPLKEGLTAPSPENDLAWCETLIGGPDCTADVATAVGELELWEAQLSGADVDQDEVLELPLSGLTSTRLRSIAPQDIESARLRSIRLRSIFLENTALSAIPLRSIRLRSITADAAGPAITLGSIIDDSAQDDTLTLGDVVAGCLPPEVLGDPNAEQDPPNCLLRDDADMGDLLDLLGVEFGGVTLLDGLTLADIQLAFTAPEDIPWESVNLQTSSLQNIATPAQPTFDYVVDVSISGGPADVDIDLTLPTGFSIAAGATPVAATFCPTGTPTCASTVAPADPNATDAPSYTISGVETGSYQLRVPVRAGSIIGDASEFQAVAAVTATGPNGAPGMKATNNVGVTVVQANSLAPVAPILQDGQIDIGYIGSSGELDAYSFVAPRGSTGASAQILLSNIPAGVDYDLAVYGPRPLSLRGAPLPERASIGDIPFDLDPGDDILPTELVNDIAVDINAIAPTVGLTLPANTPYALRDISSRRDNADEEVTLPALVSGQTYVVVVSGYFGAVSAEPYGLRVRLDRRTAIPACAASTYPRSADPPAVPAGLEISAGIDTLYITNAARLDHESTGRSVNVLTAVADTEGVIEINAGLLLLDGLGEWGAYNANQCDPAARNQLVKAIGRQIDAANAAAGNTIENIVIVGGDGVVPMAAVPDLAEYSNESTFARSVLDANGRATPVAGVQASGFFLSDDPYATDAGISILGGDHELYVPDRSIGRLVETADEIIGQLENFVEYGGKVDPRTFDAAVTGYDFLDDGAAAIIDELDDEYSVTSLSGNDWDRDDYLGVFDGTTDYRVFSPNAHYDFGALLPALPDTNGVYDDSDLVTTADFVGDTPAAVVPVRALGFTVGCHAGLSVSDVQVGPTLDWAQLYSQNNTQWVAHTTYGYGDTEIVAYSERLATLFAANVASMTGGGGPSSLGAAVRDAKQEYLASSLVISPYDEKILQSWTYYGLPMYSIGEPPEPIEETLAEDVLIEETPPGDPAVEQTPASVEPQGFRSALLAATTSGPATFGTPLGDGRVPVSIDNRPQLAAPFSISTDGSYYAIDGSTAKAPGRPVQPLVDVVIPGSVPGPFGGLLITGLATRDLDADYVPFVLQPLVDNSADERVGLPAADKAFPATLQQINDVGDGQRLLVAAGQWQDGQRLFDRITGELIPRGNTGDTTAPRFLDVDGTNVADVGAGGRGIRFDVTTETDATRVVIVFREELTANWRTLELTGSNGAWFGVAPLVSGNADAEAEFFAQSVDANGNVGVTSNKIENFLAVKEVPVVAEPDAVIATIVANFNQGRFLANGGTLTITPSRDTDQPSLFSINSATPMPVAENGITIAIGSSTQAPSYVDGVLTVAPGNYLIAARFGETGPLTTRFFVVDGDAPELSYSRDTSIWTNPAGSGLTVSATDGTGVGVARLLVDVQVDGSTPQNVIGSDDDGDGVFTATIEPTEVGEGSSARPTVRVTTTDLLDNTTPAEFDLRIDNSDPTVTITPETTDWSNGPVDVTVSAADTDSGLASVCLARNGGPCEPIELESDGTSTVTVGTEGLTTLAVTATDAVGNTTPRSTQVRIDSGAPTVTITPNDTTWRTGTVDVTLTVADPGDGPSGIASVCVTTIDECVPLPPNGSGGYGTTLTVPAGTDGTPMINATATDVAGNATTAGPVTVKIDNKAPGLTLGSDQVGTWSKVPVTVTATANDGTGSGIRELCLADTCDATTPKTVVVDPGAGNVAEPTFTATATDSVGNTATGGPIAVKVDRALPTTTLSVPGTGTYGIGEAATVTYSCTDVGSGIATCELLRGSTVVAAASPAPINTSTSGSQTYTVRATDVAGNTSLPAATTVTVGYQTCLRDDSFQSRILPIYTLRLTLCDAAGNNLSSESIRLTALTINGTRDPIVNFSGLALNYRFVYNSSQKYYEYTFFIGGLPQDNTLSFTTQPVPSRNIPTAALNALATNTATFRLAPRWRR